MKILKIEYDNFGPYGENNVIEFLDDSSLVLIKGQNGFGKSTILNLIIFSLYGKVNNYNNRDFVNIFNKKLKTIITFISNRNEIVQIERRLQPNDLQITINGKVDDKSDESKKRDIDLWIETDLIGIPFKVFSNLLVLSINDFKSFLKMGVADKRNIIDKIIGIDEYNNILDHIKTERNETQTEINLIKNSIEKYNKTLIELDHKIEISNKKFLEQQSKKLDDLKNEILKIDTELVELKDKIIGVESIIHDFNIIKAQKTKILSDCNHEFKVIKKEIELHKSGKCPTCGSILNDVNHISVLTNKQKELLQFALSINKEIKQNEEKIIARQKELKELESIQSKLIFNKRLIQSELQSINSNTKNNDINLLDLKTHISNEIKKETSNLEIKLKNQSILNILEMEVLSDTGVKKIAIGTVIPVINKKISEYLSKLCINYEVEFDEMFNPVIRKMGNVVPQSIFSTGERKMIDLIIVLAFIGFIKLKWPNINLIFLDELLSSIDQENLQRILYLYKTVSRELNMNMLTVSHTELPLQVFDWIIEPVKKGDFSELLISRNG
jgi:exonuclease SbcC